MQTANTNTTLDLFTMTTPLLPADIRSSEKKNEAGIITSVRMTVEARKTIAKRLGLTDNADNREAINAHINKMKDALKVSGIAEIVKRCSTDDWTGSSVAASRQKNGKQKMSLTIESRVKSTGHVVTDDDIVKALAAMSEDQQIEVMERAENAKRNMGAAIELTDAGDSSK